MTYQPRASELEQVDCPLCGSAERRLLHHFPPYDVVRCLSCQVHYLSPRLIASAMRRFYADDGYFDDGEIGYKSYLQQELSLRYSFRHFLTQLRKRGLTGGSLLEVGCGYGYFLDEARSDFQQRVGIDYSEAGVTRARRLADRVYLGDVDSIPAADQFDCIVMISVIEHVYAPVEFLKTLRAHLRPTGRLVIATPDVEGIYQKWLGRSWPAFQVIPEHVTFYNRTTLSLLMDRVGLRGIRPLPYVRAYPANLIVDEFALWPALFRRLGRRNLRFPGYMVALCGLWDGPESTLKN